MSYYSTPKCQKNDDLEVTGISRSGRVRKKSSKLVDFESPDDVTDHKLKKQKAQHQANVIQAQQKLIRYEQQLQQQQQKLQNANAEIQKHSVQQTNISAQQKRPTVHFKPIVKQEAKSESSSEDDEDSSQDSESEDINGVDDGIESMSDDAIDSMMMEDGDEEQESEPESVGFTKLEPPEQQTDVPSQAKSSLYMLEKYKKKLIIKDGKVINNKPSKIQRKDKGKTRYTAYMLWAKETRQQLLEKNPNLDFASISKKLGELWATVPRLKKYNWRKRAKRCAMDPKIAIKFNKNTLMPSRTFINKIGNKESSDIPSPQKIIHLGTPSIGNKVPVSPPSNKLEKNSNNDTNLGTVYKPGIQPIDVAAHLTLLGESLTIIGKRLKEHEGQITVSGSLPLLLDSLICALGPLLCLTQQIPEMNGASPSVLISTLENVSYIMPGL